MATVGVKGLDESLNRFGSWIGIPTAQP